MATAKQASAPKTASTPKKRNPKRAGKPAQPKPNARPQKTTTAASRPLGVRVGVAEFAAAAAQQNQIPPCGLPEVAFAGRSNVGKSSLLNMLLSRKIARTSNTPGCTRQLVFFDVEIAKGPKLAFVDLPGYGYAKVARSESAAWKRLLEGYLKERETLRGVILLVDVRRGLEKEERDLVEFLATRPDLKILLVATKLDKLARSAQRPALDKLARSSGVRVVGTSSDTGAGREDLWRMILDVAAEVPATSE